MATFIAEHVKFRNGNAGKSPIGAIHVFNELVEWRDAQSPHQHKISLGSIKALRVSPPEKSRVQLQIVLQNDEQATFVFVRPNTDKKALIAEREELKERINEALHVHRQAVKKITASADNTNVHETKKILDGNRHLGQLYKMLVFSKMLTAQEFWEDRFNATRESEDRTGSTGAFLASIARSDADGLKLSLNRNIVQTIFAIYPVVERKHLELVPHLMSEEQFWVKFASSHYFLRSKEVLPNPDDPFADCIKADEEEIAKLVSGGAKRRRLNFDYLSDNTYREFNETQRADTAAAAKSKQRATLIRRSNFLSERIVETLQTSTAAASETAAATGAPSANTTASNGVNGENKSNGGGGGFAFVNCWADNAAEGAIDSVELAEEETELQLQPIKVQDGTSLTVSSFAPDEAARFQSIVNDFIDNATEMDILDPSDDWLASPSTSSMDNGFSTDNQSRRRPLVPATQWGALTPYAADIRVVHEAVNDLAKHFWTSFPPLTPELEAKCERMELTLRRFEQTALAEAEHRFGVEAFLHSREMMKRAHERYVLYKEKKRK